MKIHSKLGWGLVGTVLGLLGMAFVMQNRNTHLSLSVDQRISSEATPVAQPVQIPLSSSAMPSLPPPVLEKNSPVQAFQELLDRYSQYNEAQLNDVLEETDRRLEQGDYIDRANLGRLSEREQQELTEYLRTKNAVFTTKAKLLLQKHIAERDEV